MQPVRTLLLNLFSCLRGMRDIGRSSLVTTTRSGEPDAAAASGGCSGLRERPGVDMAELNYADSSRISRPIARRAKPEAATELYDCALGACVVMPRCRERCECGQDDPTVGLMPSQQVGLMVFRTHVNDGFRKARIDSQSASGRLSGRRRWGTSGASSSCRKWSWTRPQ